MFYVRQEVGYGVSIQIPITDDNTYAECDSCGKIFHTLIRHEISRNAHNEFHSLANLDVECNNCRAEADWDD